MGHFFISNSDYLTKEEVKRVLAHLSGTHHLMAGLLYGAGLRLMECVRLRVKDIDYGYGQIIIRDGKGEKDRRTVLPSALVLPLKQQAAKVAFIHEQDLGQGYGSVYLPYALERKYPNASLGSSYTGKRYSYLPLLSIT